MNFAEAVWVGKAVGATGMVSVLMSVTVRGTILLLLAAALVRVWPRASAAQRHIVWTVACCSLLLLPLLPLILPAWHVRVPSGVIASWDQLLGAGRHVTSSIPGVAAHPRVLGAGHGTASLSSSSPSWLLLLIGGWGIGTLVVLGVLGESQRRMRRFVSEALPLADVRMLGVVARAARTIGMARDVPIRLHPSAAPVVCGTLRPVIVLPASACTWDETRLYHVILHELAHVQRYDCLIQAAASVACAVYWFNPLVWGAARSLQIEQEHACDDAVLSAGSPPYAYVTDLLDVTQAFQHATRAIALPALPFARPSHLQTRLESITDRTRRRNHVSRWRALIVCGCSMGVIYPLVGLRPQRPETQRPVQGNPVSAARLPAGAPASHQAVSETLMNAGTREATVRVNAYGHQLDISVKEICDENVCVKK